MKVFWLERRSGQRLVLTNDDESDEIEVGAVRKTPRGFDALAKTNTYDPGRAQKDFATMEEAKAFVESFHPWDVFGGDPDLEVEDEIRPSPGSPPVSSAVESDKTAGPGESSIRAEDTGSATATNPGPSATEEAVFEPDRTEDPQQSRGWRFWKRG